MIKQRKSLFLDKNKIKLSFAAALLCGATGSMALDIDQVQFFGYGNINYEKYEYFDNAAKEDESPTRKSRVDVQRFVLAPRYLLNDTTTIIAEIEYEHGGTGSSLEVEREEAGELELEVEKGGEIVLEEINVILTKNPALSYRVGHFPVAIGLLTSRHLPNLYHSATRNRSESRIIPATWHETGVEVYGSIMDKKLHYQVQLINGLNSEGFSSYGWVKGGHQTKFEDVNADDLAINLRLSYGDLVGNQIGFSYYQGDTSNNRTNTTGVANEVSGRGTVKIISLHGVYSYGDTDIKALYMLGSLGDNAEITASNKGLPQYLNHKTSRSVAKEAIAYFIEVGHNLSPLFNYDKKIVAWGRYDFSDTMKTYGSGIIGSKKYEETTTSVGLNYHYNDNLIFKSEFQNTAYGSVKQDTKGMKLSLAFQF